MLCFERRRISHIVWSILSPMANLSQTMCGVSFQNPLVIASGILGVTAASWKHTVAMGAGGITTKSIWRDPHPGHKNPTMFGTEHYFMNAVGLSDAGVEKAKEEIAAYMADRPAPLIANIVGGRKEDFVAIAQVMDDIKPDLIEVNISCPNVEDDFGKPFACDRVSAAQVTRMVKAETKIPVFVKLSPNVENIADIARAVADAGADGITAINTVGPGMRWDIDLRSPLLSNRVGGVSGPAIFPIAVKAVHDIAQAVDLPIIATGGVMSGRDALELIMVGGTLVGMGTIVYYRDDVAFRRVEEEMKTWMEKEGVQNLEEIRGCLVAH